MKRMTFPLTLLFGLLTLFVANSNVLDQAGFDDDRVMLQGFYWESYRHGHPRFPQYGSKKWYDIVKENAGMIRDGRFDLIWLPPPFVGGRTKCGVQSQAILEAGQQLRQPATTPRYAARAIETGN